MPYDPAESCYPRVSQHHAPRPRTAPPPQPGSITLGATDVPYTLRISPRARHIRLVIRPQSGLEVVLPRGTSRTAADRAVREKATWIATTLQRVAEHTAPPPPLEDGRLLLFCGQPLRLSVRSGASTGRFHASRDGTALTLTLAGTAPEMVRVALEAWYRHQARGVFAAQVERCNAAYGFTFGRIRVKDQKSRWGSCSRAGNLNFSWRLLLAPSEVLDYVVYHELAHLKEANHSPRFWALVATVCPRYREQRRWLRQHGPELRF